MKKSTDKPLKPKVIVHTQTNAATRDSGKVRLGDGAITFLTEAPKKVTRVPATADSGKVRLGDMAPTF
jgi:hypothetical protein